MQGSTNPPHSQRSPRLASQQWDRFEVALSKPSGRQKLGMVLKHAQIVGEDKVKRGAYLASLAEGPSVAQDLGLAPKDRLISIEGLDVKTLPFDRIVACIRKASFPLTLVWSRQRKEGVPRNLPGRVVEIGAQRAVENRPVGTLATKAPEAAPAPSPDAAAGGADREPEPNETTNGEAKVVSSSTSTVDANKERRNQRAEEGQERSKDGKQRDEDQQQQQELQQTLPEAIPAATGISGGDEGGSTGEKVEDKRGVFPEKGARMIIDRNKDSVGGNSGSSTSSNIISGNGGGSSGMSLADAAEDWIRTTGRGRAASRAAREAESLGGEGRGYGTRRVSAGMIQGADHVRYQRSRLEQRGQLQQKHQVNIPTAGNIRQQQQPAQYDSIVTHPLQQPLRPGLRQIQGLVQGTAAAPGAKLEGGGVGGGAMTPLQSLYLGHSHRHQHRQQLRQQRSGVRPVSEAAASAVAEVLSHQGIVPTTIARQKSPSWLQGSLSGPDGGGVVEGGVSGMKGTGERGNEEENLRASKEKKVEDMKARRRERDKARREKIRREAAAGDMDRMLHEAISLRQQQQHQLLSRPQGAMLGKGKRSISGRSIGVLGTGAEDVGGAPDWLNPLMKAELKDFMGTRYCRSRLKQTLCHEWLRQEYKNGIALGQVDKDMPEIEFMQRRMVGGSLYALLEQESKDYLRPGAFTDADVELIGTNFAHAVSSTGGPAKASGTREPEVSWADRLRNFQIDVPSMSYDLTASDDQERSDALECVAVGGVKLGVSEVEDGAWDGRGVQSSIVIKHRRIFDARCCAYEALNSSSRNDKTSSLLDRTQRLYQDHANFIVAKRTTLEGTLENVQSQLRHREEQLHHLRSELSRVNPMDATAVAALAENESVIVNRISEKELQMSMILEEVNKVIDWERTTELARREAMQHAADVHGNGGASAEGAARERGELVQAMMSQKATLVLLSTFCKLRGPWLAPNGYVRRNSSSAVVAVSSAASSSTATAAAAASNSNSTESVASEEPGSVSMKAIITNSEIRRGVSSSADQGNGRRAAQSSSMSRMCDINSSSSSSSSSASCSSSRNVVENSVAGPERQPLNGQPELSKPKPSAKKPEQKIKSIKLRLRLPSSKDDPGVRTRSSTIASGQGAKATTATATTADEGGGRRNGVDDVGDSTASSRRRSSAPEITASTPASSSSSSPRAPWGSSSCMAAVMARGGKEAAMARLGSERRAAEAAKSSTETAVPQEGDECGALETAPSHRKLADGGGEGEGVDGRSGGGSSDSVSERADIDGGGSGSDDPMGDGDPATSMEEGDPMEDGIGPLSFESVGSSSPCSSQRMEALCFGEDDDAGGKNERDGVGNGDNQFGDSGEM